MRPLVVAMFLLVAITLGACGQMSLKHGMKQYGSLGAPGLGMPAKVLGAVFTPYVLLGLSLYALSSGFWLVVISPGGWALSYAYPMIAFNYVVVVFFSRLVFGESVQPLQWVGILFICTGLVFVARFGIPTGVAP